MNKISVQRLIDTAPPSWKTMFQRYDLGPKPTVDELIETVLEYTPSMRGSGGRGEAQYSPPKRVREEAWKGLVLSHRENYTSQSGIGLVRAMQLVSRPKIWDRSIRRMQSYFDRHQKDQNAKNFGNDANPSRGWMAWLNWGGDSGKAWADRLVGSARVNPKQIKTKLVEPEQIQFMGFDKKKVEAIRPYIPEALKVARRRTGSRRKFPTPIVAMAPNEIMFGRTIVDKGHPRGAGHGMYFERFQLIKINPYMDPIDLLANVVHENLHHLDPNLPEEVVAITTAEIMDECFGIYTLGRPLADGRLVLHFNPSDLKGRHIPEKYLKGLSAPQRKKRIKELTVARDRYDKLRGSADTKRELDLIFSELPSDKVAQKKGLVKQSAYSKVAFDRGIEINRKNFKDTARRALRYYTGSAKASDVDKVAEALQKSFSKGIGAWASGGHRPGATKFNWGDARVHSLLVGGKTYWSTDKKQAAAFPPAMRKAIESQLAPLYRALKSQGRQRDVDYIKAAKKRSR